MVSFCQAKIMSKKTKLEAKIRNNLKNVSLSEFEALISMYGTTKMGSKHAKAEIGESTLTYKRINPIPPEYVEDLLEIIDSL